MVTNADWQRTLYDESFRPQFLREICLGESSQYVEGIEYLSKQRFANGCPVVMSCWPPKRAIFGLRGGKSVVSIYPQAFTPGVHVFLDDFLSTLFDHEIEHAKDYKSARWSTELQILSRQLHNINTEGRNVSRQYMRNLVEKIWIRATGFVND